MKSLLLLWQKVAEESATRCCTSATMDIKTVQVRCEYEGLSFITITLSDFGKDFQKSLEQGQIDRRSFQGFQFGTGEWRGLPRFLGGFLDRVFDRSSGRLLPNPCIDAILAIRQLALMFGKISLPCSDARTKKAMRDYVQCEKDVREFDAKRTRAMLDDFKRISNLLYASVFTKVDREIYHMDNVKPKHGPGATADKLKGNQKFNQRTWTTRLEQILPSGEMLLPNWRFYRQLEEIDILEPGSEIPVKVIPVPKTLKTPRIIAVEPTAMQYAQQSILALILDSLSRDDSLDKIIGFDDQTPNQRLAMEGSHNKGVATLDLSEASDRVSNQLVRTMLQQWPHLHMAVDACRSRRAAVPGHGEVRLAKFASMGSALCFPFEAMVFTTLILLGIEKELNRPLRRRDVKHLVDRVRVYGDDIIVPVEYVRSVVTTLEAFGLVVNRAKSFWNGNFRESCGKEYFMGHDVSIVKVRQAFPSQRKHVSEVISMISLRNQLYFAGYWKTCQWLDDKIRKLIKHFPVVLPSSSVLGRHSFLGYETQRVGRELHNPLVKGYVISPRIPLDSLDDTGALLKFFLKRGGLPSVDRRHLERAGRPQSVDIKLRWTSSI